ncbi:MAG: hypothetical protein AAGI24_16300 [Pseudomonadota bacterium]
MVLALLSALHGAGAYGALDNRSVPTAYGDRFYDAAQPVPEALPPRQGAPEADAWQQRIRDKTYESGPYGPGIAETVEDAGRYFLSRGDYNTAIQQWRRAVHLIRVNDGLYSQRQLPLLERLLETYLALGDYERADETESYLHFLSQKNYAEDDSEQLQATLRWLNWQRQQWLRNPDVTQPRLLLQQWRMLTELVKERDAEESTLAKLTLAEREALVQAQLSVLLLASATDFGLDRETDLLMGSRMGDRPQQLTMEETQIRNLQESGYSRGRGRLQRLLARQRKGGDKAAQARTLLALGDWHIWFDSPGRAAERYRESWDLLTETGDVEQRQRWFGAPVELPENGVFWAGPGTLPEYEAQALLQIQFDVTPQGRVRELALIDTPEQESGRASVLLRQMRSMRFRPRLADGEAVITPDVVRSYRVR